MSVSAPSSPPPEGFSSPEAEIHFWKCRADVLAGEAAEARQELEEFQEGSRELEAELETQLRQAEDKLKDQRSAYNRLQLEHDVTRDKLEQVQREYHAQVRKREFAFIQRIPGISGHVGVKGVELGFCYHSSSQVYDGVFAFQTIEGSRLD